MVLNPDQGGGLAWAEDVCVSLLSCIDMVCPDLGRLDGDAYCWTFLRMQQ